jgi:DNA-binding transcriptional regulator LsrR (DeoR family)
MARVHELRLIAKAARLYHERGLKQNDIAQRLNVSQSTVSRLLVRAIKEKIVRVSVLFPAGACPELEEELQERFGLQEAIVVDTTADGDALLKDLGAAAAFYIETTVKPDEVVGISSWSATLLAMVDAMQVHSRPVKGEVVQILGGVGRPEAEVHAAHLTQRLAKLLGSDVRLLPAPGVVGAATTHEALMLDPYVREAMAHTGQVSLALVGIGAIEPSRLLASSGNVFAPRELDKLKKSGAVGDVCLRFFDADGKPVTDLDNRVVGITLKQLRKVQRCVGIAGGKQKHTAILGALRGKWVNVLITDIRTAEFLVSDKRNG